jgi:LAO/AO transport system kinase
LAPFAGHARIVGITGPPGAGKSTLVDALASALRRQGKTLAVLAVDPTSRLTGGAILGDRIRMQQHHADPAIFIRSMATRGNLGGLARATADLVRLMDAAGKDYVLIETVGVGQDEIEVAGLAQVTVVVLVPGMGDDVQAIKAGILEIADVFVINKSDQPGADRVERELEAMLGLARGRRPPIVKTVAPDGAGIEELLQAIAQCAPSPRAGAPQTVSIDHLGMAVRSLDQSIAFYQALGLAVTYRETVDTGQVHAAMLPVGDSRIELLEPSAPDSPLGEFLATRGPGLHHVALRVPDLKAAVERLRAGGARLLDEPRTGPGGPLYVFVHPASAGGVLLELIEESGK